MRPACWRCHGSSFPSPFAFPSWLAASAAVDGALAVAVVQHAQRQPRRVAGQLVHAADGVVEGAGDGDVAGGEDVGERVVVRQGAVAAAVEAFRSDEHTYELQSLMRITYAVSCLTNTNTTNNYS